MMIVRVRAPDHFNNYETDNNASGIELSFTMYYPHDSYFLYGKKLVNRAAYRSESGKLNDGGRAPSDYEFFRDLDNDGEEDDDNHNTLYDSETVQVDITSAFQSGFTKKARSSDSHVWDSDISVSVLGTYLYQLRFANRESTTATGLIIYDVLDNSDGSQWKGKVLGIESIETNGEGLCPVVYYSTNPDIQAGSSLISPDWETTQPADPAEVTAIAIDMREDENGNPYQFAGSQSVICTLRMEPPDDYKEIILGDEKAVNQAVVQVNQQGTAATLISSGIKVGLREPDVQIRKTSHPESGTREIPAEIEFGEELSYTVEVWNSNQADTLHNIKIEDVIPQGLTIQVEGLKVYFDNNISLALPIQEAEGVRGERTGQKLVFYVDQLLGNEKISFLIPTLAADDNIHGTVFENTAELVQANQKILDIKSETTYHQLTEYEFSFLKVDETNEEKPLPNSKFLLYDCQSEESGHEHSERANEDGCWNLFRSCTSNENGVVAFDHLHSGEYRLVEAKAPDGYVLPQGQWKITIKKDGNIEIEAVGTLGNLAFKIKTVDQKSMYILPNRKKYVLPLTGGKYNQFVAGTGLCLIGIILYKKKIIFRRKRE